MKNKQIIDSWNKIEPGSAADGRMLEAILARNHAGQSEKEKVRTMNRAFNWKRLGSAAACLIVVVMLTAVIGNNANWFNGGIDTADLGDKETLNFYKSEAPAASSDIGINGTSRDLTADELKTLFGELPDTSAYGTFGAASQTLVHLEGKSGNTTVILAAPGIPVTDTVINTDKEVSEISGIPVAAGYFVTKANSEGMQNAIYFASFKLGDVSVYVERGGPEPGTETYKTEISSVIEQLIQNGAPDLSKVKQ